MRYITLFLLSLSTLINLAQELVQDLITDRPDQTESSVVVPHKSLQIETGFVLENNETDIYKTKSLAYNTTLLRYGLLENLELRLGIEYLGEEISIKNTDTINSITGLSPLYAGFKIFIAEENGIIPEIAFLGGLSLPFTAKDEFTPTATSVDIRFSFAHTFSDRLSLGYNLGAEMDGETINPSYFYSLALGIGISEQLGAFVESYGLIPEEGDGEHLFDAGLTYLLIPNLQFDVSGGIGLSDAAIDNFISIGFSWRIPE